MCLSETSRVRACPHHLENDPENDFPPTSRCSRSSGVDYPHYPVWRRRCAHHSDKKHSKKDSGGAGVSLRRARHANHGSGHRSARNRYSAMGELLSLALPSILGICFLLFGEQLCDSWIRGCGASVDVAPVGSARKHGRHADVRSLDWTSVRGRHSSGRRRIATSSTTSLRTRDCGSHRPPTKAKLLLRSVAVKHHILKNS